jgi:hypothetical protein
VALATGSIDSTIIKLFKHNIFILHTQFYFVAFGLKIIGHRNPDNNLESAYILILKDVRENEFDYEKYKKCLFQLFNHMSNMDRSQRKQSVKQLL